VEAVRWPSCRRPVAFVGTGQDYDDLEPFDLDWMVDRLFS